MLKAVRKVAFTATVLMALMGPTAVSGAGPTVHPMHTGTGARTRTAQPPALPSCLPLLLVTVLSSVSVLSVLPSYHAATAMLLGP